MNPHLHAALMQSNTAEIARQAGRNAHAASIRPQQREAKPGRVRATVARLRLVPRHA
ncbi:MAG: hypothetical protein QOF37_2372 [Thermoleophilaceae bacterium]|jgi:hypothetical protein|nr:hypothetical protein [Thermoleophilaceae bacterium]